MIDAAFDWSRVNQREIVHDHVLRPSFLRVRKAIDQMWRLS